MNAKYIRFESDDTGDSIVVFPGHLQHSFVAERLACPELGSVKSAGNIALIGETLWCGGGSHSLKVESLPEDQMLVEIQMRKG